MWVIFSFSLRTQFGLTERMGLSWDWVDEDDEIEFEPPFMPIQAMMWRPEFLDNSGRWRCLAERKRGEKAFLISNDPADLDEETFLIP